MSPIKEERSVMEEMMTNWIKGDLDDMIYADCECRVSDR